MLVVRRQLGGPRPLRDVVAASPGAFLETRASYLDSQASEIDAFRNLVYAMLGLTVACARCHEHKFDPISARDYYRVVSVFSGVKFDKTR